ncbi:MAG: hypothetical protein ACI82G_002803 [Bradymonadia bacterium]|jgi:hypothetical protein
MVGSKRSRYDGGRVSLFYRCLLAITLIVGLSTPAEAQRRSDAPDVPAEAIEDDARRPRAAESERSVPDYDNREAAPPTPGQRALWVPRILLAPVWVISEYVVRRPLEATVLWAEQSDFSSKVRHALTFGTGGRVGFAPTALVDFGLRPSAGLYFWTNGVPTEGDRLRIHLATGGRNWWRASVTERISLGDGGANLPFEASQLNFRFLFEQRPDHLFYGLGPQSDPLAGVLEQTQLGGAIGTEFVTGELDGFAIELSAKRARYADGAATVDRADGTISQLFPTTPNVSQRSIFGDYRVARLDVEVTLDSRAADTSTPGDGVRLEVGAAAGMGGLLDPANRQFAERTALSATEGGRYFRFLQPRARLGLFWDVNNYRRVLSLTQTIAWSESTGSAPVPAFELPAMGGTEAMRSWISGRFRGHSTVSTTLQWTYPTFAAIDGFVFAATGQAFGRRFEGFALGELQSEFGMGIRSNNDRDAAFEFLVGVGTTPLGDPVKIESVRMLIGASSGF